VSSFVSELNDDEHYLPVPSPSRQIGLIRSPNASAMGDSVSTGDLTPSDGSLEPPVAQVSGGTSEVEEEDGARFYEAVERSENADAPRAAELPILKLSSITVISSQIPTLPQQRLSFSTWTTIIDQEMQIPQHNLSMSPITPTFVQGPIPPRGPKGLYFVAANAIVYGFTTCAAILFVIRNVDEDFQCGLLASEMGYAFMAAVILCVVLHVDLADKIWAFVEGLLAMLGPKDDQ
jgi:hypothetical protein